MSISLHSSPITMIKAASFMSPDSDTYPFSLSFSMQSPKPAKSPSFVSSTSHHNKLSFHGIRFSSSCSSYGLRRMITHVHHQEKRKSTILLSKESCTTFLQTCSFCMQRKDKYTSFLKSPSRLNPLFSSSSPPNATSSTPSGNDEKGAHPLMINLFCSILSKSLSYSYKNFHSVNIVIEGNYSKIMNDLIGAIEKIFLGEFIKVKTSKIDEGAFQFNSSMVSTDDLNVLIRFRKDESFKPNKNNLEFPNFKEVVVINEAPVFYYPLFRTVSVCETMSFAEFCVVFCQMMFTDASPIASNNIVGVPLLWFYNLHNIKELDLIEQIWEKLPSKVVSKLDVLLDQTVEDYTFHYYNELTDMNESLDQRIHLFLEEEKLL